MFPWHYDSNHIIVNTKIKEQCFTFIMHREVICFPVNNQSTFTFLLCVCDILGLAPVT